MHQLQVEVEEEVQVVQGQTELPSSKPGWPSWQGTMRWPYWLFAWYMIAHLFMLRMRNGGLCMWGLLKGGQQNRSLQITSRLIQRLCLISGVLRYLFTFLTTKFAGIWWDWATNSEGWLCFYSVQDWGETTSIDQISIFPGMCDCCLQVWWVFPQWPQSQGCSQERESSPGAPQFV